MKRILILAVMSVLGLSAMSCAVTYDDIALQVMRKSRSGLDFRQKSVSAYVIYRDSEDSTAYCGVMTELIKRMSEEYGISISLYTEMFEPETDYSDRAVLADMLTATNSDVVLVSVPFDSEELEQGTFGFRVSAYDSMSKSDIVAMSHAYQANEIFVSATAKQLLDFYGPNWSAGVFRVLYVDGNSEWLSATDDAFKGQWTSAIDKWIAILEKSKSTEHRMAAEYDIALGCYLTGNIELAGKWIVQAASDVQGSVPPAYLSNLRALINKESQAK